MQTQTAPVEAPLYNEFGGTLPQYIPEESIDKRMTRWVFNPGDVMGALRKTQVFWLRHGGEELKVPTNRLFNGTLPKCVFVPLMESAAFDLPQFGPTNLSPTDRVRSAEGPAEGLPNVQGLPIWGKNPLIGIKQYPGDDIATLRAMGTDHMLTGRSRGLKEIEELRGHDWDDRWSPQLQAFFFPNFAVKKWDPLLARVPVEIRAIEDLINDGIQRYRAGEGVEQFNLERIGVQMLAGCREFRGWAEARIQLEHDIINDEKTASGFRNYSELGLTLLPQVEMDRIDKYLQTQKDQVSQTANNMDRLVGAVALLAEAMAVQNNSKPTQDDIRKLVEDNMTIIEGSAPLKRGPGRPPKVSDEN